MVNYYNLESQQRGDFDVEFDWTYEDLDPRDHFDESYLEDVLDGIQTGRYTWFMLRARVFFESVELADEYLGGLLYEDPATVMTDGVADDLADTAVISARHTLKRLLVRVGVLHTRRTNKCIEQE